jgi:hypothetical protein
VCVVGIEFKWWRRDGYGAMGKGGGEEMERKKGIRKKRKQRGKKGKRGGSPDINKTYMLLN